MQIRTLEEYNHLRKVYFNRVKELNQIQSILDIYAETFEPKIESKTEIKESPEILPNNLPDTPLNKINSQKTKRKPKKKS